MTYFRAVLTLTVLLVPMLAGAQVFRCTNPAGKVEYSDTPCSGGGGRTVIINQNVLPGSNAREQGLQDENHRLRKELEVSKSPKAASPLPAEKFGRTEADLSAEKGGSIECTRAKRSYEVATSSIQENRNTDADELAMYSACGIKPPDKSIINVTNIHVGGFPTGRMTKCDRQNCWDEQGNRYQRGAGGTLFGPRGVCTQVGLRLDCP